MESIYVVKPTETARVSDELCRFKEEEEEEEGCIMPEWLGRLGRLTISAFSMSDVGR